MFILFLFDFSMFTLTLANSVYLGARTWEMQCHPENIKPQSFDIEICTMTSFLSYSCDPPDPLQSPKSGKAGNSIFRVQKHPLSPLSWGLNGHFWAF